MRKLRSNQLELLKMFAITGWCSVIEGPELACARGLHRRKVPLIELEVDEEASDREAADLRWVARLTDAGASVVAKQFNWKIEADKDGTLTARGVDV